MYAMTKEVRKRPPATGPRARPAIRWPAVGSLALALTLVLVAASPAVAQIPGGKSDDRCAELLKLAGEARSLDDLRTQIQRERTSETVLERCAEELRRDGRVADLVEREHQEVRSRVTQMGRARSVRSPGAPEQLPVNRRVVEARQLASARLSVVERRSPPSTSRDDTSVPDERGGAPAVVIEQVTPSPVVPGTDLVIEGAGFGSSGGAIELALQGMTFEATVNEWTDTWISAWLDDDVEGVAETDGAVLRILPQGGSSTSRTLPFVPIYETDQLNDMARPYLGYPMPGERDETFAHNWSLENGWRLAEEPWTQVEGGIECEIDGSPVPEVGDTELATQVQITWDWFEMPFCTVFFDIEGPKGFEHGFESSLGFGG